MKNNVWLFLAPAMAILSLMFAFVIEDYRDAQITILYAIMFALLAIATAIYDTRKR